MAEPLSMRCLGYFHLPELWLGGTPSNQEDLGEAQAAIGEWPLPGDVVARVHRDGLVLFDFGDDGAPLAWPDPDSDLAYRMSVANAHLACLYSTLARHGQASRHMAVDHSSAVLRVNLDEGYLTCGDPTIWAVAAGPGRSFAGLNARSGSFMTLDGAAMRTTIAPHDAVSESFEMLERLMTAGLSACTQTALLLKAAVAADRLDFDLSVVSAWAVVEHVLASLWDGYVADQGARHGAADQDRDRRRSLKRFSSFAMAETLELVGVLDAPTYKALGPVRRARNQWVHGLESPTWQTSWSAIRLASDMLAAFYEVPLLLFVQ